jgi:hypothetical protein
MKISVESNGKYLTDGVNAQATTFWAVMAAAVLAIASACTSTEPPPTPIGGAAAGAGAVSAAGVSAAGSGGMAPIAGKAGAAAGTAAPGGAAAFSAVLAIFADPKNNCALCHAMATIGGGLIFNPTDRQATFQALVGVTSKGASGSQCGGKTYVVAGQPDASLLYNKLASATPPCGARMPASGTVLSATEIETVRAWIAAGALNN